MPKTKNINQFTKRPPGRPTDIDGKRVNVYLDAASLATAARLGDGNVSAGIRQALTEKQRPSKREQATPKA